MRNFLPAKPNLVKARVFHTTKLIKTDASHLTHTHLPLNESKTKIIFDQFEIKKNVSKVLMDRKQDEAKICFRLRDKEEEKVYFRLSRK